VSPMADSDKTDADEFIEIVSAIPTEEETRAEVERIWAAAMNDGDLMVDALMRIKNYLQGIYGEDSEISIDSDYDSGTHNFVILFEPVSSANT